jgi:hypothetical protein
MFGTKKKHVKLEEPQKKKWQLELDNQEDGEDLNLEEIVIPKEDLDETSPVFKIVSSVLIIPR